MVTLELPFPPSVNAIWLRGKPRGGKRKGNVYLNPKYTAWQQEAWPAIIAARRNGCGRLWGRFTANITLDDRQRKGRIDCDNRVKVCLDFLQKMMVIDDDSQADSVTVQWGSANGVRIELREAA